MLFLFSHFTLIFFQEFLFTDEQKLDFCMFLYTYIMVYMYYVKSMAIFLIFIFRKKHEI